MGLAGARIAARMLPIRVALAILAGSGCTAAGLGNAPLAHWEPGRATRPVAAGTRSDELLLILAFSGGGTRAAAFAYGVLEELAATPVALGGSSRSLLDEVDLISAVSGGSFTAAYYGLYGDRMEHRSGPEILINATDLSTGSRFGFTRFYFDPICSDLSSYRVALAVTASSAVPVLLAPVTLENRAGACEYQAPALPVLTDPESEAAVRLRAIERSRASYLDRDRRHFIHLMDGGISDNLGLRGLYERVLVDGGIENTLRDTGNARVRDVVLISVNAQTEPAFRWDLQQVSPSLIEVLDAVTSVQINRYNFETVALFHTAFDQWTQALSTDDRRVRFHFVSVSFDDLRDEGELRYLNELPTSFQLEPQAVDRLRAAARTILRQSPEFQALRQRLARPPDSR
jgi:NTE family protein